MKVNIYRHNELCLEKESFVMQAKGKTKNNRQSTHIHVGINKSKITVVGMKNNE